MEDDQVKKLREAEMLEENMLNFC